MPEINIAHALISVFAGGFTVSWIAKLFFSNYINKNDQKHKENQQFINDILVRLSIIETKIDAIYGIRDKIILLEERSERLNGQINTSFEKIRSLEKRKAQQ